MAMSMVSKNISDTLRSVNLKNPSCSTLSQRGNLQFVERFLSENIQLGEEEKETVQSQLYIASFWGFQDIVKSLVEQGADVNFKNKETLWTPLHAASFQEHGKIIMYLLGKNGDPYSEDYQGRTPVDFASVSDKIWAFFAACGCEKTSKSSLYEKNILKLGENNMKQAALENEKKSTIKINYDERNSPLDSTNDREIHAALVDGDVLAGQSKVIDQSVDQPNFNMWRS